MVNWNDTFPQNLNDVYHKIDDKNQQSRTDALFGKSEQTFVVVCRNRVFGLCTRMEMLW